MWKVKQFLQLSHGELDLVILANIQAYTLIQISGEKRKRSPQCSFTFQVRERLYERDCILLIDTLIYGFSGGVM